MRALSLLAPCLLAACAPAPDSPFDRSAAAGAKLLDTADSACADDSDGDGVADCRDACPDDSPDDADGDGLCDSAPATTLSAAPRDSAIYQRGADDTCTVELAGAIAGATYVTLEVWDGETRLDWYRAATEADGSFSVSAELTAGLVDHDILLRADVGADTFGVAGREAVACGDLFLVQGQSNAVAADYWGEGYANDEQSPWIRSFGTASTVSSSTFADLDWETADGEGYHTDASIGAWALHMARNLLDSYEVPIGVINGAVGGTYIHQHQRNDASPADLSTIYGRFLYRAQNSTFQDGARVMFWYQGESDGGGDGRVWAGDIYSALFDQLRADWYEDFPALEQIYVVQVRKGCGVAPAGMLGNHKDVREAQRQLPALFPDVRLMSATALDGHDSCHYTTDGYLELGDRLTRQVAEDFYGEPAASDVDPPSVAAITWDDATTLRMGFEQPDQTLSLGPRFKDYFRITGAAVTDAVADGGEVVLSLSGPTPATTLSWEGYLGTGGDLVNANGVGMLSFQSFPITP